MIYLGLFVGLLIPFLLGKLIMTFIDRNKILSGMENIALSFLFGLSGVTLLSFWFLALPIIIRSYLIGGIIVVFFLIKIILFDKGKGVKALIGQLNKLKNVTQLKRSINFKNAVIMLLLIGLLIKLTYVFIEAGSKPEYSFDAGACWTLTAKTIYYLSHDYPSQVLNGTFGLEVSVYYPKQIALSQAWLYDWMREANDQWGRLIFPTTLLAFVLLFFTQVRREKNNLWSLFFTYLLFSAPYFAYMATIGYADFTVAVYFSAGIIFFHRWIKEQKEIYFWLFAIFIALTTWIKIEGKLWLILSFALLTFYLYKHYGKSLKEALFKVVQYFSVYLVIGFPWQVVVWINQLQTREKLVFNLQYFNEMQTFVFKTLFIEGTWGIFWFAMVAVIMISWKKLMNKENIYLIFTAILFYGALLFIFLLTDDGWANMNVSFNRILLSLYPVMVYTLAIILPEFNERDNHLSTKI